MKIYLLEPEVCGGIGDETVSDSSNFPPVIYSLHYVFDDWLGDDLIESFPCYLVTKNLKKSLENSGLNGFEFHSVKISTSEIFNEIHSKKNLPEFSWIKIKGTNEKSDFFIKENKLAVSERAFDLLKKFNINHCDSSIKTIEEQ